MNCHNGQLSDDVHDGTEQYRTIGGERCSRRILTPMPMTTRPATISSLLSKKQPIFWPIHQPLQEIRKVITPMAAAAVMTCSVISDRVTPTARASILVATLRVKTTARFVGSLGLDSTSLISKAS